MTSWQHSQNGGMGEKSAGIIYLGSRLFVDGRNSIESTVRRWKKEEGSHAPPQQENEGNRNNNTMLLRIPLCAEHRTRQADYAMELIVVEAPNETKQNSSSDTM